MRMQDGAVMYRQSGNQSAAAFSFTKVRPEPDTSVYPQHRQTGSSRAAPLLAQRGACLIGPLRRPSVSASQAAARSDAGREVL